MKILIRSFSSDHIVLLIILSFISLSLPYLHAQPMCKFAELYSIDDIFHNSDKQHEFIESIMYWEGQFQLNNPCLTKAPSNSHDIGYHNKTGLTLDGHRWSIPTGLPLGDPHLFTAPSKESIHLGIIAQVLNGNKYASIWLNPDNPSLSITKALSILSLKINSYEQFYNDYPAFGGFLPWIFINDTHIWPTNDFANSVPSLDNGQMIWALMAIKHVLAKNYSHVLHTPMKINSDSNNNHNKDHINMNYIREDITLLQRYEEYIDRLKNNALIVFLDYNATIQHNNYTIRTVSYIHDLSRVIDNTQPWNSILNYYTNSNTCNPCYLDDPYEGELFINFLYLYIDFSWFMQSYPNIQPYSLWITKRDKLQSAEYIFIYNHTVYNITVQRGWWFSSHEQWKYLFLPYFTSEINTRIYVNGERARTWNSVMMNIPGLYASVTGTADNDNDNPPYVSDCGINSISFSYVSNWQIITPYATFPLMLIPYTNMNNNNNNNNHYQSANISYGLAWYYNMLNSEYGQTCFGSIEGLNITGYNSSPLGTWDTKQTTVLAILGGNADIIKEMLSQEYTYEVLNHHYDNQQLIKWKKQMNINNTMNMLSNLDIFTNTINDEWSRVFTYLNGEDLPLQIPNTMIPNRWGKSQWPSCTVDSNVCLCDVDDHHYYNHIDIDHDETITHMNHHHDDHEVAYV